MKLSEEIETQIIPRCGVCKGTGTYPYHGLNMACLSCWDLGAIARRVGSMENEIDRLTVKSPRGLTFVRFIYDMCALVGVVALISSLLFATANPWIRGKVLRVVVDNFTFDAEAFKGE